jgi:hypothetical protein
MAFTDAVFDGSAKLDSVFACKINTLVRIVGFASDRLLKVFEAALASAPWHILVDVRMRKSAAWHP